MVSNAELSLPTTLGTWSCVICRYKYGRGSGHFFVHSLLHVWLPLVWVIKAVAIFVVLMRVNKGGHPPKRNFDTLVFFLMLL